MPEAYPSAGGSLSDEVSVRLWRMLAPGLFSVPAGSFVSRCHVHVSGVASVLPAGSVARTSKVCRLSVRPLTLCGLVHGANEPPSIRHSKVEPVSDELNVNVGVAALDGSAGLATMVVFGAVRSTSTLRIALEGCPALSVATAARAWLPSEPGIGQDTLYGPGVETVPSGLQTPVAQSALWFEHSKNSTWLTPLPPPSSALAEKVVGLGREPLIAAGGEVIETEGGTLSTRILVFSTLVSLPASSVALPRRS